MPARYQALVAKVRDWSNRDAATLPDSIVEDAIRYAEDHAYRNLRIPPLENTMIYTITQAFVDADSNRQRLKVPTDLSEFISFRSLTLPATPSIFAERRTRVYNQKADYRTFNDYTALEYDYFRWTRSGNDILIHPSYEVGQQYELFYYRRLPALWALFDVNATNWRASRLDWFENPVTTNDPSTPWSEVTMQLWFPTGTATNVAPPVNATTQVSPVSNTVQLRYAPSADFSVTPANWQANRLTRIDNDDMREGSAILWFPTGTNPSVDNPPQPTTNTVPTTVTTTVPLNFRGKESPNWLRDDQEKLIIWGALSFIFGYLGEDAMQQKYLGMFTNEIQELNDEEGKRRTSGGNLQQNFPGYLI